MPDITNPQGVRFCNERARVFADALLTAIGTARAFKAEYDANSLDNIFPNTTDVVADNSDIDGRVRVTGQKIRALYSAATDLITWADTGTPTRETRLRGIAVNAPPRF